MKMINKDGVEEDFKKSKIIESISRANAVVKETEPRKTITMFQIATIANRLYERYRKRPTPPTADEIEEMIEVELMKSGAYEVAKVYIRNRCKNNTEV